MRRVWRVFWASPLVWLLIGCGNPSQVGNASATRAPGVAGRRVHFVGFDSSEPLNQALKAGKIEGLVVQDPFRMGELGVRTLVDCLEKRKVEPVVDTGETMVTPENLGDPEVAALTQPAQGRQRQRREPLRRPQKKWRVLVIPKGTTHEFWKTIHSGAKKAADDLGTVDLVWQGPQKEDDRLQQIQLVQTAIASRVDGIVLAPLDSRALVKPVEEAVAKGIPVVDHRFGPGVEQDQQLRRHEQRERRGTRGAAARSAAQGRGEDHPLAVHGRLGEHRGAREGVHRDAGEGVPRGSRSSPTPSTPARRRTAPAEGPEPGDAVSRPGRRRLLPERVEHGRGCSGRWKGRGCSRPGRDRRRC